MAFSIGFNTARGLSPPCCSFFTTTALTHTLHTPALSLARNTSWWGFLPSLPLVIQVTEGICAHHHHLPRSKRELEAIPATTTLPLAIRVTELTIRVTAGFVPITTPSLTRNASGGHPCQLPCRSFKCKPVIITTTSGKLEIP